MAARRSTSLCRATDGEVWRGKVWSQRTGGDAERESVMYRLRRVSESCVRARGVQRAIALPIVAFAAHTPRHSAIGSRAAATSKTEHWRGATFYRAYVRALCGLAFALWLCGV